MEDRIPSDVVKAIFHYLGRRKRFSADVPKIHTAFFTLSQEKQISNLLSEFIFDASKAYPHSDTVESALDRLQKVDLLACINPSLDQFEITEALAEQRDIEDLFSNAEKKILKKSARKFLTLMNAY